MLEKDKIVLLKELVRYKGVSDSAKITLLEFIIHFWSGSRILPSYTELCAIRKIARSTVQLHIEELEKSKLLISVRLPNNRKRYLLNSSVLNMPVKNTVAMAKPKGEYRTAELVDYFFMLLKEMTGNSQRPTREDYLEMKELNKTYSAVILTKLMDVFKLNYRKRKWGTFTVKVFSDNILKIVSFQKIP